MSSTSALRDNFESSEPEVARNRIPKSAAASIRAAQIRMVEAQLERPVDETASALVFASPKSESSSVPSASATVHSRIATFTALQEWDGYVFQKNESSFTARLTDITAGGPSDNEEVEIPYEELDEASVRRLELGSLFRWSIGYDRSISGQKTRVSRIIIRQLPRWRKSELEKADRDADRLSQSIKWQE